MTNKQLLFMKLIEEDNKSDLAKYFIIWDAAQKELLEDLEKEFNKVCDENVVHRNQFEDSGDLHTAEGYESGLWRARNIIIKKLNKNE